MREQKKTVEHLEKKIELAKKLYSREGFFVEFLELLDVKKTATETYYNLEEKHDDLFGVFKFPTLNSFYVWTSKRRKRRFPKKPQK
jgi:hypothetical protein